MHNHVSISSITDFLYRNSSKRIVGPELYGGIHDIVIDGRVEETADSRRRRFDIETSDPEERKYIYALEAKIEELGERLGFTEIGTYDSIHLIRMFSRNDKSLRSMLDNFDPKSINTIEDYQKFIESAIGGYANGIIREQ